MTVGLAQGPRRWLLALESPLNPSDLKIIVDQNVLEYFCLRDVRFHTFNRDYILPITTPREVQ